MGSRFDLGDESQQSAPVVALRKSLAVHDVPPGKFGIGVEESVGGHQVHAGMVVPAGEQCLQHARRCRLAYRDAASDADNEGDKTVRVLVPEEGGGGGEEPLAGGHLKVNETSQRQVDLGDLGQIDLLAKATQAEELFLGEDQRRGLAQRAPLFPVELHIGARLAQPRHGRKSCRNHS
ncbi:Uncharacterised protein [Mycobacteroides abscessus subsp. massiliense]|nr:Uncharacterised protein [Mycobacteroides abscessus subsp. massiliense]